MRLSRAWLIGAGLLALGLLAGCSDDDPPPPVAEPGLGDDVGYKPGDKDVLVVDGKTWIVTGGSSGGGCIKVGTECWDIAKIKEQYCGSKDAQADIVVVDGKLVKVICYPPKDGGVDIKDVPTDANGNPTLPQNQNNTVIKFPASTDGKAVSGDVRVNGENVSVIGNGVDKTILGGNLAISSNNAKVRGLTVNGNVTFEKNSNGASIAFCKIKGNLIVESNSVSILSCQVFGNIEIKGSGAILVGNGVGGKLTVEGSVTTCSSNYAFKDANANYIVEATEKGATLSCAK